ncbi:beta-lactamase family protein [candidate division KSB1 bacterium]|nr:beta-lactamase family protein [candidate division KSB1 bacterium]
MRIHNRSQPLKKSNMKTIVKYCLFFSIILSFVCCNKDNSSSLPSQEKVNKQMNEAIEKSDLPAVVAIAINKNGEKVNYSYGNAVWKEDAKVTPEHIFRIWSMTKLVTSIAAMQCVENGLIGLDDDLSIIMPEMTNIPILSNGELIEPKRKITLRHLLTHTSGFGYSGFTVNAGDFNNENWNYEDSPRHFESGTDFLYGTSTDWAGKLVEKLSNMNLEEYFKENITQPLGMTRTFFNVPDSLHNYIVSWGERGNDGNQKLTESPDRVQKAKVTTFSGGGGLFSSPSDYTKILQCLLNEGKYAEGRILRKETIAKMIRNQIGDITLNPEGRYFDSGTCCNFNGLMSENSKWGLAFMIDNNPKYYGRKEGSVTWGGYMNTYFFIDFKLGIAASIYTQHMPFNHFETTSLFERFSEIIYAKN